MADKAKQQGMITEQVTFDGDGFQELSEQEKKQMEEKNKSKK